MRSRLPATRNLRWRLTLWVGGVLLISAALMFVAIYRATGDKLRAQIDRDIAGDARQLEQSLAPFAGQPPSDIALAATRYMDAQPFNATSTLLFVLVPGAGTSLKGRPSASKRSRPGARPSG